MLQTRTEQGKRTCDACLQVLMRIQELNSEDSPAWFTRLCKDLPTLKKQDVLHAINTLTDWVFIYGEYGETEKGRAGRIYFIDEISPLEFQPYDSQSKLLKKILSVSR